MKPFKTLLAVFILSASAAPAFTQTTEQIVTIEKVRITSYPWERHRTTLFDWEIAREKVGPFMRALHPDEPAENEEVEIFKLVSQGVPAPNVTASTYSTQSGRPEIYLPENDRMDGLVTPALAWLGHARLRIAYALQNAEGNRLLLNKDKTFTAKANTRKGECDYTLQFYLYNARFTDIQIGYLEIEAIGPPAYEVMEITPDAGGQTLLFGDIPVEVHGAGTQGFALKVPLPDYEKVFGAPLFIEQNGHEIQSPVMQVRQTYWPVYQYYLDHPDITREEWEAVISGMDPAEFTHMALVYELPVDFDKVWFYREHDENHERVIGSRIVSFRKDDDGEYSYTPLWKDERGVLRPFGEEAGWTPQQPPVYIGGMQKMQEEIDRKLVYPEIAKQNGIEGRVVLSAEIDEKGRVQGVTILQKVYPTLDQAALDAFRALDHDWEPGTEDGKPVRMNVLIPVVFTLDK